MAGTPIKRARREGRLPPPENARARARESLGEVLAADAILAPAPSPPEPVGLESPPLDTTDLEAVRHARQKALGAMNAVIDEARAAGKFIACVAAARVLLDHLPETPATSDAPRFGTLTDAVRWWDEHAESMREGARAERETMPKMLTANVPDGEVEDESEVPTEG